MSFIKYKVLILLGVLTCINVACKEDPMAPSNNAYSVASENFAIEESFDYISRTTPIAGVSDNQLVFYAELGGEILQDTIRFKAKFNERVSWEITIKSLDRPINGPVKVLTGLSDELNPTNVFWVGDSDNIFFFSKDEKLEAVLTIAGSELKQSIDDWVVLRAQQFEGVLVVDFDGQTGSDALIKAVDNINVFFQDAPINEEILKGKFVGPEDLIAGNASQDPGSNDPPILVQGDGYVYLKGQDDVAQTSPFFIGGFNNAALNFGLDGTADDWYFNFFANSNGNRTTKIVVDIPGTGGDLFNAQRDVTWEGWKLISIKLSDFVQSQTGGLGGNGLVPRAIRNFTIGMHSGGGVPGNKAELAVDYVIFTKGGPFNQKNIRR